MSLTAAKNNSIIKNIKQIFFLGGGVILTDGFLRSELLGMALELCDSLQVLPRTHDSVLLPAQYWHPKEVVKQLMQSGN